MIAIVKKLAYGGNGIRKRETMLLYESTKLDLEKDTGWFVSEKGNPLALCKYALNELFCLGRAKTIWVLAFDEPSNDRVKIKKSNCGVKIKKSNRRHCAVIDGKLTALTPGTLRILNCQLRRSKAVYVQVMLEQK